MKRTIFILAILLGIGNMLKTMAQSTRDIIPGVSIENFNMNREGKYLTVEMNLDLNKLNVDANRAVLLTPRLVNGTDSLDLPSVGIYGRRRYYYYVRNGIGSISGENETVYRVSDKPDNVAYNNLAEYEAWMDGAISIRARTAAPWMESRASTEKPEKSAPATPALITSSDPTEKAKPARTCAAFTS